MSLKCDSVRDFNQLFSSPLKYIAFHSGDAEALGWKGELRKAEMSAHFQRYRGYPRHTFSTDFLQGSVPS